MPRNAQPHGDAPSTTTTIRKPVRIAALGDLHCTRSSAGKFQTLFAQISESADMVLLAGDLTDSGQPEEARILARELSALRIPGAAVLGNHDYECGHQGEVSQVLADTGLKVLDGEACEINGIGVAGVKGFCGGFGTAALGPWGEPTIKQFVHEAVNEALKLEASLARVRSKRQVVLLHYSPIRETVEGEPLEIYPFVGSSRLEEPIGRYRVNAVFHGHAHRGTAEGRTSTGVPVYNVSLPLLNRVFPGRSPFLVLEVAVDA